MECSSRLDWTNVLLLPHEGGKITISASVGKRVGDTENISESWTGERKTNQVKEETIEIPEKRPETDLLCKQM